MRTVRKGTRSCWACRRRKVRCTFADPSDSACVTCRRRSVRCIGQEFPDDPQSSGLPVGARLGHVEALIEQVARRMDAHDGRQEPSPSTGRGSTEPRGLSSSGELVPEEQTPSLDKSRGARSMALPHQLECDEDVVQALQYAWPSQQDLDIILSIPVPVSRLFHGVIFTSYSTFMHKPLPRAADLLQMPALGRHPIMVARRLLLLSTYLQNIPPSHPVLSQLSIGHERMTDRAFETVTRLVTSNDHLVESVEGVECMMMESMYHNNAGNLRRAWFVLRKAIGIAQLLGLNRRCFQGSEDSLSPIKMIDPVTTGSRVDPDRMWFRLIASDRYLSLMLGLPEAVANEDDFLTLEALQGCTAMEHMERMIVSAGGRILWRNRRTQAMPYDHEDDIMETDRLLQQTAALMPPKWWLIPSPTDASSALDEADVEYDKEGEELRRTLRLMTQMAHYHLLVRLHLPYLICHPLSPRYEYSRTTAANASRELLARYVSFRLNCPSQPGPRSAPPYCRGVDFLAFVASTVLCLLSIDARKQKALSCPLLSAHQRPTDRGLMEHTLDIMERMAECNGDPIATKVASILRPLLFIEADTARSVACTLNPKSGCEDDDLECGGRVGDEGDLHIRIPHLGTIDIEIDAGQRGDIHATDGCVETTRSFDAGTQGSSHLSGCDMEEPPFCMDDPAPAMNESDWALQGVDFALFEGLIQGM